MLSAYTQILNMNKSINHIFLLCLLANSLIIPIASGQHSKWQISGLVGVNYLYSDYLTSPINDNREPIPTNKSFLSMGYSYGFSFGYNPYIGIQTSATVTFSDLNPITFSNGKLVSMNTRIWNFSPSINIYFLKYLKFSNQHSIANNLFIELSPILSILQIELTKDQSLIDEDEREELAILRRIFLLFHFGIGYDIFLSEKISITPLITYQPYLPFELENYYQDIGYTMNPSQNWSQSINFSFKISYTIKPTIPLCSIRSCSVSLYHKHNTIGNKVVRGTILSKPQNTQVAEKIQASKEKKADKSNKIIENAWITEILL